MTLELDTPTLHRWCPSLTLEAPHPRDAHQRRDDTSADVLAYEIVRYMPELADLLATQGRRRLMAA